MSDSATVVLIHGAWHGAWCWEKVVPLLDDAGIEAVAIDLPLTSLQDDVRATTDALDRAGGRVILCGHSYGGVVISEAGHHSAVEHLVYVCAFACDEGESPAATAVDTPLPSSDLGDALVIDGNGIVTLSPELVVKSFYHDCDPADAGAALARIRPMNIACLTTPIGAPAWRTRPSTYAVCTDDQAVHPELQRLLAKRCTNTVEWPTAHSPFINRPDLVASLLTELAR